MENNSIIYNSDMTFNEFENALINSIIKNNSLYESDLSELKKIGFGGNDSQCVYELLIRKLRRQFNLNNFDNYFNNNRNKKLSNIPQNLIDNCIFISNNISDEINDFMKNNEDYKCDMNNYETQSIGSVNNRDSYNEIGNRNLDDISIRFTDLNEKFQNSIANKFGYSNIEDFMVNNLQMNFITIGSIHNIYESNKIKNNYENEDIKDIKDFVSI